MTKEWAEEDKVKFREALDKIAKGEEPPEGFVIHTTKTTTKEDWDKLDPNSYETSCANEDCGEYIVGTFGPAPDHELSITKCPKCGGTKFTGIGSPAGAYHLAMHDPSYD